MTPYLFCLLLGSLGLLSMALIGLGSEGHDLGGHDLGGHDVHAGHDLAGGHDAGDAHLSGDGFWSGVVAFLTPRVAFSVLAGAGAVGLVAERALGEPWAAVLAVAGGLAFERFLARPLWNLVFRFGSRPAATLEQALLEPATAATGFDREGDGLILLVLGGETRQLLGSLRAEDRAAGVRVRAGDRLLIEEVNSSGDRCVVSWVGPGDGSDL
jgi:hypothetical protein